MGFKKAVKQTAWAKIGISGKPGSGKTTLLAMLALHLSIKHHNRAPVAFTDSEKGSDFLVDIFELEGVPLMVEKSHTLKDLITAQKRAKAEGACAWVGDSITKFWAEAGRALKAEKNVTRLSVDLIGRLKDEWAPFADDYIASQIHSLVAGRLGGEFENSEYEDNGNIKKELIRTGSRMKAEGEFAHDFDLELEMASVDDPDAVNYEKIRGKARKKYTSDRLYIATVKKCRVWELTGQAFRWSAQKGYKKGYYEKVALPFLPYFNFLNIGGPHVASDDPAGTSRALFASNPENSYYQRKIQREILIEKWDATMEVVGGAGRSDESKNKRRIIGEMITGTRSKTEFEHQVYDRIELQLKSLLALEKRTLIDKPKTEDDLRACIAMAIEEAEAIDFNQYFGGDGKAITLPQAMGIGEEKLPDIPF